MVETIPDFRNTDVPELLAEQRNLKERERWAVRVDVEKVSGPGTELQPSRLLQIIESGNDHRMLWVGRDL